MKKRYRRTALQKLTDDRARFSIREAFLECASRTGAFETSSSRYHGFANALFRKRIQSAGQM